jgi:urease gamma subunit
MRVNEYLLGKGFLPEGESRTRLQRYKATRKKIATSIDAKGEGIWDDKINAHRMIAETLRLNQIDIAPADRAGISDLSAVPLLTQEMAQQNGIIVVRPIVKERKMEEKETVIKELKSSDAALLPEEVRSAIIQEYAADIKKALGLDGDIVETVKKIRERDEERERQSVSSHIKEIATSGDKAIKVEDIREMVIDMVQSRNPKTVAEVDTFYAEVLEKDSVKKALERSVQETMGPNQSSPFQKQTSQKTTATGMKGAWFVLPEVKE